MGVPMARKNNNRGKSRRPQWSRHEAMYVAGLVGLAVAIAVALIWFAKRF